MDPRRSRSRLVPILVALAAILVIWFLPDISAAPPDAGLSPVSAARGEVLAVDPPGDGVEAPPDAPAGDVLVRVLEGPRAGEELYAFVALPSTQATASDFEVGDEVVITFTEQPGGPALVGVGERWRLPVVLLLVVVFVGTILLVAGWQGLRALLSLALTVAVAVKLLVPAILEGVPPVPLAIVVAGGITIATILLTEGTGRVALAAIAGTVGGLAITGLVSVLVGLAAELSGAAAGELYFVQFASGESLDTRGLLLAAIIIGAVGVLDDMTVTQAATVEGLARGAVPRGGAPIRDAALWSGALRIGRSHVAATVNTLFMAYVGASLPALVFLVVAAEPAILTLNRELLTLEVVRTLAGGLGIVLAMPLTTAIAIGLVRAGAAPAPGSLAAPAPGSLPAPPSAPEAPDDAAAPGQGAAGPERGAVDAPALPAPARRRLTSGAPRTHGMRRSGGRRGRPPEEGPPARP